MYLKVEKTFSLETKRCSCSSILGWIFLKSDTDTLLHLHFYKIKYNIVRLWRFFEDIQRKSFITCYPLFCWAVPAVAVCMKHKIGTPLHKDLIPNAPTIVRLCVTGIILFWNGCSCAFIFHRLALLKSLFHCYPARMLMVISNSLPWEKLGWTPTNKLFALLATLLGCVWGRISPYPHLLTCLLYFFMGEEVPRWKKIQMEIEAPQNQQRQNSVSTKEQIIPLR